MQVGTLTNALALTDDPAKGRVEKNAVAVIDNNFFLFFFFYKMIKKNLQNVWLHHGGGVINKDQDILNMPAVSSLCEQNKSANYSTYRKLPHMLACTCSMHTLCRTVHVYFVHFKQCT